VARTSKGRPAADAPFVPLPLSSFVARLEQRLGNILPTIDRDHLEMDQIRPGRHPPLEQADVVTFHQLEALREISTYPTVDENQPIGALPALVAKSPVDGHRVAIAEIFDDHEHHSWRPL
jgi:hypothetical protein